VRCRRSTINERTELPLLFADIRGDTSASERYYAEDVVDCPAVLNHDGTLSVPAGPGIGVDVVPATLDKHTLSKEEL